MHQEIASLEAEIIRWQRAVDTEGVWLFLASLGCWSVTNRWFQITAFVVALILFASRLARRKKTKMPYSGQIGDLKLELKDDATASAELDRIARDYLTLSAFKRGGLPYLLCWFFFVGSFVYSIWAAACPSCIK